MRAAHNPYEFYSYDGVYGEVAPTVYLQRTHWEDIVTQPVVFADAQVLAPSDVPSTGILNGAATIVDTSTGSVRVEDNFLKVNGAGNNVTGIIMGGVSNIVGRMFQWKVRRDAGVNSTSYMGVRGVATLNASNIEGFRLANVQLSVRKDGAYGTGMTISSDTIYTLTMISLGTGFEWYVQGGTQWPHTTLLESGGVAAAVDLFLQLQNSQPTDMNFGDMIVK